MVSLVMATSSRIIVPMDDLLEISRDVVFEGKVMSQYDNLD
jgi:hypothetical protein